MIGKCIDPESIRSAALAVSRMNIHDQERLADEIYRSQPNLLASILVQRQFGATDELIGTLLKILFTCFKAMQVSGKQWQLVTESMQERALSRLVGKIRFNEGLPRKFIPLATGIQMDQHPERNLFQYVIAELDNGPIDISNSEAEKYAALAALNIVETVAIAGYVD